MGLITQFEFLKSWIDDEKHEEEDGFSYVHLV